MYAIRSYYVKVLRVANELLGTDYKSWDDFKVNATPPAGFSKFQQNARSIWMNFVKSLANNDRIFSSSEMSYQKFLINKYGSLTAVNKKYGWNLQKIEEAFPPLATAYTITFLENSYNFV